MFKPPSFFSNETGGDKLHKPIGLGGACHKIRGDRVVCILFRKVRNDQVALASFAKYYGLVVFSCFSNSGDISFGVQQHPDRVFVVASVHVLFLGFLLRLDTNFWKFVFWRRFYKHLHGCLPSGHVCRIRIRVSVVDNEYTVS